MATVQVTATMSGGEAFLRALQAQGVQELFSSPGSEWPPVWEALAEREARGDRSLRYVNCRHEEVAVGLAMGYAKASGRLPAVLLHTTVGVLHASMALRVARHERLPLLVAAGESITYGEATEVNPGAQWLRNLADVGGPARLAEAVVKWSSLAPTPETLPGLAQHACRVALSAPQGPVLLSIPLEVMLRPVRAELVPERGFPGAPFRPEAALLDRAAELLVDSRHPLLLTEHAGRDPRNVARLVALAEALAIPVVEAQSPQYLNFPRTHPLHLGFDARPYLAEADVVLLLGAQAPWHPPSQGPARGASLVWADDDPARAASPYWSYRTDLWLAGSPGSTLEELLPRVQALKATRGPGLEARLEQRLAWARAEHQAMRARWADEAAALADRQPVDTRWLCRVLGETLPEQAIVVEETITSRPFIERLVARAEPGTFFAGTTGGLGLGLSQALGLKFAQPERLVVALIGDGSFNYNPVVGAFGFAQEYETPLLVVLFNNGAYVSMRSGHLRLYPRGVSATTGLSYGERIAPAPDYAAIARAFGGYGARVEAPGEARPALQRALREVQAGRLALLDVALDPRDARER